MLKDELSNLYTIFQFCYMQLVLVYFGSDFGLFLLQVFDEADMLLCGSFQNQIIHLINMLRFDEKQISRMESSAGPSSMQVNEKTETNFGVEDDINGINYDEIKGDEVEPEDNRNEHDKVETSSVKDWRRVRKVYTRSKQYIFIAATLPVSGKKTAGGVLKRMFPDAVWVSGNYLHCYNPRLVPSVSPRIHLFCFSSVFYLNLKEFFFITYNVQKQSF